jgi:hypothetical protein
MLLTIPHPVNANHNGGMLAFGPDGYLYIGVGDGGAGNDPPNNAQSLDVLLGKILRIDVDHPDLAAGTPYSAPSGNPFASGGGRAEIFAYGMRNPWRFSFDRVTGMQWVADVGQGAREEVDMPIVAGGNYGWRVYEGSVCTNLDPTLCDPSRYRFPVFDYEHTDGRCSITGGYVYRGAQQILPGGTYVYGDYCSGEIFAWDGTRQTVLLHTPDNIASFGEDEQGELYVVALGGSVSRIAQVFQALDQHGLTGSWYEPATSGQGIEVEVFPDLAGPGNGSCRSAGSRSTKSSAAPSTNAGTRWAAHSPAARRAPSSRSTATSAVTSTPRRSPPPLRSATRRCALRPATVARSTTRSATGAAAVARSTSRG